MSLKRRDNKNRILRDRESQCKDGRYRYTYYVSGKQKCLYSWKLERTDRLPKGKRECVALRDQIAELNKVQSQGIAYHGGGMTVLELVDKYTLQKKGVRYTTQVGYRTVINILKKDEFGSRRIDTVKLSDAKIWLIGLQDGGRGYSSIHSIRGVLRPAFQMAVDDDLLLKNPFEFQLATVVVNDSVTRESITRKQERQFLEFVKNDKHFKRYYEGIYILFKTGMRISEFCGLTMDDIDLKNKRIVIDHQLQRTSQMQYVIQKPKTDNGNRMIPMSKEVYECFETIINNRKKPKTEFVVDGKKGFLYLDKNDRPMVAMHWEKYFQHIREKYNKIYKIPMPKVTPHVCRHTYCSNMAKSGMNPKTLQYLMGHSDIGVTLNTYTHLQYDDAKKELKKLHRSKHKKMADISDDKL